MALVRPYEYKADLYLILSGFCSVVGFKKKTQWNEEGWEVVLGNEGSFWGGEWQVDGVKIISSAYSVIKSSNNPMYLGSSQESWNFDISP